MFPSKSGGDGPLFKRIIDSIPMQGQVSGLFSSSMILPTRHCAHARFNLKGMYLEGVLTVVGRIALAQHTCP